MLSEDVLKKLNFIVIMVTNYKQLILPIDWWYSSYKRSDGYIYITDLLDNNKSDIDKFLAEHSISYKVNKKRKTIKYELK